MTVVQFVLGMAIIVAGAGDDVDVNCGRNCLFLSLRALDLPPETVADLEMTLGYPSTRGYSLEQLDTAAKHYGAHTLAVQTSVENLRIRQRPFACIANIKGSHFVNIADFTERDALIIDAPRSYRVPIETLLAMWDGKALLVASSPLATESELSSKIASGMRWRRLALVLGLGAAGYVVIAVARRLRRRRN